MHIDSLNRIDCVLPRMGFLVQQKCHLVVLDLVQDVLVSGHKHPSRHGVRPIRIGLEAI